MEINLEEARHNVYDILDWTISDIVIDIIDRIDFSVIEDEEDLYDSVWQATDESLIYTEDKWKVLACYFSPLDTDINFTDALSNLINDIMECINRAKE